METAARRTFVFTLSLALLAAPVVGVAQDAATAQADARRDAAADTNGALWFGAGCLFGLLGVGAAYLIKPNAPATRLMGKSSGYTAVYTDEYQRAAVGSQTRSAWFGCCTYAACATVAYVVYYVLLVYYYSYEW
jgi:hypothetical protein